MKLFSYYKKAVIYPLLFVLFFCIIYSFIDNYKNEWAVAKTVILISIVSSLIFSLLMGILSLPIFLNKFKKLNKNLIWNILTWFLLPFSYAIVVIIHDLKIRIKYEFGLGNDFFYLLIMVIPFVIGLCWSFIKFRQKITTTNTA